MFGPPRLTDPREDPEERFRDYIDGMTDKEIAALLADVRARIKYAEETPLVLASLKRQVDILLHNLPRTQEEDENDDEDPADS